MRAWRHFGVSVIGPGHLDTGAPNQDSWAPFHAGWGTGIVVSDGVGSRCYSDWGSRCACRAVIRALCHCGREGGFSRERLADRIKDNWLHCVTPLPPADCAATCLLAVRMRDGSLTLGQLGDGLAAAVRVDGSVSALSDEKEEGFSNTTDALSPRTTNRDWRWLSMPDRECEAVLLCTDGVADDLTDTSGFVKAFVSAHRTLCHVSATRSTRWTLLAWPTPKHSDDKTIACLLADEVADEQP